MKPDTIFKIAKLGLSVISITLSTVVGVAKVKAIEKAKLSEEEKEGIADKVAEKLKSWVSKPEEEESIT